MKRKETLHVKGSFSSFGPDFLLEDFHEGPIFNPLNNNMLHYIKIYMWGGRDETQKN